MNPVVIRKVNASEIAALREISIKTFVDSFAAMNSKSDMEDYLSKSRSIERIREEYANPESRFYFALLDERPVGYLKVNWGAAQIECKDENSLEIQQIYIDRDFQNKKIGQSLFDKAIELAIERDFDFIWLGVWEKNQKAIKFYERNGFSRFGQHSFQLGRDLQTDILMKRDLR